MSILKIQGLHFSYARRCLFDDIHLSIENPGITCITGHNGSGKSSFLRLLHGLIQPQRGSIIWQLAQPKIAMVFQKPLMLKRSVLANIQLMLNIAKSSKNPQYYLNLMHLDALADKNASTLSAGEQQKLAFLRILALQPDILLLDEPCANLDKHATAQMEQLFLEFTGQGKSIFLVSHNRQQVQRLALNTLHISKGRIVYV